ncbi:putative transmembrane protein [Rhodopirellula islandica]|uniref:Transmembrane protein n=1 Tax=Rhodopirellula islandica TaxID=595434 RepID=A0A0J1B4G1_RHOIS|nr:hypothetical protein [Rhodopirellula islandica]KLU01637.1 putative transmembrane protein [Rhodopirellula islandica]
MILTHARRRIHRRHPLPIRRGLAAMGLVLALALLVGTFAIATGGRATQSRRHDLHHQSVALLESAIRTAQTLGDELESDLRLPVDEDAGVWIDVKVITSSEPPNQIEATLVRNNRPGMSIRRLQRGNS